MALPRPVLPSALAALALLLAGGHAAQADDPPAAPVVITSGALDWGVKASFRRYVGAAGITVAGGVTRTDDATSELPVPGFSWPLEAGTHDTATKATTLQFAGTVHFSAHGGALDLTIARPKVVITGGESTLYATVSSRSLDTDEIVAYGEIPVGVLDLTGTTPVVDAGTTTWPPLTTSLTPDAAPPFAGFYPVGTTLDPVAFAYDGPGGKPVPIADTWDLPHTLEHEQAVANAALRATSIHPDAARDVVHVVLADGTIRALDPDTLEPKGAAAPVTAEQRLTTPSASVYDRERGALLVQSGPAVHELRWDAAAGRYDDTVLPGAGVDGDMVALAYNEKRDTLAHVDESALTVWRRDGGGWTREDHPGPGRALLPDLAIDDDGTLLLTDATGAPRQVDLSRATATYTDLAGDFVDPDAIQPGELDGPSEVEIAPDGTALFGWYLGRVQRAVKGADGRYAASGSAVTHRTGNVLRGTSDPADGTFLLAAHGGDAILQYADGRLSGQTRVAAFGLGTTTRPLAIGADRDHSVYAQSNTDGLLKLTRVGFSPTITDQPRDAAVTLGVGETEKPATFTAAATGTPAPAVRWQTRAGDAGAWHDVDGATDTTLTLPATVTDDGLQVRAVFSSVAGRIATEAAGLRVQAAPGVAAQPDPLTVTAGDDAVFKVMPTGNPYPAIQWERRDAGGAWTAIDGADEGFLTLQDVTEAMSGTEVRARLANTLGTVHTRAVTLTVQRRATGPVTVTGGFLDWGVKASFRRYIVSPVAHGDFTTGGGATENADGTIRFPVTGGRYDADTGELRVDLAGDVLFTGHQDAFGPGTGPALIVRVADPQVAVDAAGRATLHADVSSRPNVPGASVVDYPDVALAELDMRGKPVTAGDTTTWASIPATLTAAGAPAFAGFYAEGTELDPLTLTIGGAVLPIPPPGGGTPETPAPAPVGPAPAPLATLPSRTTAPAARVAPRLTTPARLLRVGRTRTVTVARVACPAGPCRITAPRKVRVRIGGRTYTLAVLAPKTVASGRTAAVRVRLTQAAYQRLRGRRVTVSVRIVATAGSERTVKVVRPALRR